MVKDNNKYHNAIDRVMEVTVNRSVCTCVYLDWRYSVLSLGALFLSVLATVFGLMSLPSGNPAAWIVGGIGILLGFVGIYFALLSLGVHI